MNGLLRSNFYATIDSARIVVVMLLVLGGLLVASGSASLLSILTLASAPLLALMAVASQRRENSRNGVAINSLFLSDDVRLSKVSTSAIYFGALAAQRWQPCF